VPIVGPERSGISATLRQQRRRVSVMPQSLLGGRLNKCAKVRRKEEKLTLMEFVDFAKDPYASSGSGKIKTLRR
jgi:hypothetical protein